MEQSLLEDFEYFRTQSSLKLKLTETINTIFSLCHQTYSILNRAYFEQCSQYKGFKLDKYEFLLLKPTLPIIEYINNELDLSENLELDIKKLEQERAQVAGFIRGQAGAEAGEDSVMNLSLSSIRGQSQVLQQGAREPQVSEYQRRTEEFREFCRKVAKHGLTDFQWQVKLKVEFERRVAELKQAELEHFEEKNRKKKVIRQYKDTMTNAKNKIENIYLNRLTTDLEFFKTADKHILQMSQQLEAYFKRIVQELTPTAQLSNKAQVLKLYSSDSEEILDYNPEWPPFRDIISDEMQFSKRGIQRKLIASFGRLIGSFESSMNFTGFGSRSNDLVHFESGLDLLGQTVDKLTEKLAGILDEDALEEFNCHHITEGYKRHYDRILLLLRDLLYKIVAHGPLRRFIEEMKMENSDMSGTGFIGSKLLAIQNKYKQYPHSYGAAEFWNELSLMIYRFNQDFFEDNMRSTALTRMFLETLELAIQRLKSIGQEILEFNKEAIQFQSNKGVPARKPEKKPVVAMKAKLASTTSKKRDGSLFMENSSIVKSELLEYLDEDTHDFKENLNKKYQDAKSTLLAVYKGDKFSESFTIKPEQNMVKVTFLERYEEIFLNIPAYFHSKIKEVAAAPERPKFVYIELPKPDEKNPTLSSDDNDLKEECDREFKYFKQDKEDMNWKPIHETFFENMTMNVFVNLLSRDIPIKYQNEFFENIEEISLTRHAGSITQKKKELVGKIDDCIKKGSGFCKFVISGNRPLPVKLPFFPDTVVTDTIVHAYLLSPKHFVKIAKNISHDAPGTDCFYMCLAADVTEQSNGIQMKWNYCLKFFKSTMLKMGLEMAFPGEIKKNLIEYIDIVKEVWPATDPKNPALPPVKKEEIKHQNVAENPVFFKDIPLLNKLHKEQQEQLGKPEDTEFNMKKIGFERNKAIRQNAIPGKAGKQMDQLFSQWSILKSKPEDHVDVKDKEDEMSFEKEEGGNFDYKLDESEKKRAYIVIGFMMLMTLLKVFG